MLAALPIGFLLIVFVIPMVAVAAAGLEAGGVHAVVAEIVAPATLRTLSFTVLQAALSAGATAIVSAPLVWALSRYRFAGRSTMRALSLLPFVLPTVVAGLVFLSIFGPSGWAGVDLTATLRGLVVAHVFMNIAVFVRTVSPRLRGGRRDLEDAAAVLGATPAQVLRHVIWPGIRSAVAASAVMAFMFCFTTLGVVTVMGGGAIRTLEVLIYRATLFDLDLTRASALALLQMAVLVVTVGVLLWLEGRVVVPAGDDPGRRVSGLRQRFVLVAGAGVFGLFVALPMLALVASSLTVGGTWSLAGWAALISQGGSTTDFDVVAAIMRSLRAAALATFVALPVGIAAAAAIAWVPKSGVPKSGGRGRSLMRAGRARPVLKGLVIIPLGTSAATLGLGLLLAYGRPPVTLPGWLLVPLAQALVALPFIVRILTPAIASFDHRLLDAAALLGAPRRRAIRTVMLPALRGNVLAAGALAFALSMGEFGATAFVSRSLEPTLPLAIVKFLGRPGDLNVAQSYAASCVLLVVVGFVVLVVDRAGAKEHL